jgi:hypothetical protein
MLFSKANELGAHDGLLGFTGISVTVRSGSVIITYGEIWTITVWPSRFTSRIVILDP